MERRTFLKKTGMAAGTLVTVPYINKLNFQNGSSFRITDMHVHTTNTFTMEVIMDIARKQDMQFGVVEHPASWAIKDDTDLKKYIDNLRKYPVYIGLQPTGPGWSKNFSPELLQQLDYVLMDPQNVPMDNGETLHIWQFDTYVADTEKFMDRYMEYSLNVLNNEPIHIFGWPLFLPVCIARDYYTLWTEKRMQQLIDAAKMKNIAFEINDMAHTPHDKFIMMAKEQGLKFTFGSDARTTTIAGKMDYCKAIAKKCGLKEEDFWSPKRKLG